MEKIFEDYKGIVLFYAVILILSIIFVLRLNAQNNNIVKNDNFLPSVTYPA